jgi:hypothetical protein
MLALLAAFVHGPGPAVLALAVLAGAIYFASCRTWPARILLGGTHALVQLAAAAGAIVVVARFWPWRAVTAGLGVNLAGPAFIAAAAALAAVVAATLLGVYLLLSLSLLGLHWNEAFSALRIAGYKNVLRLHIAPEGTLRVYAIGLRAVPRDRGATQRDRALKAHLIEGPIVIPVAAATAAPGATPSTPRAAPDKPTDEAAAAPKADPPADQAPAASP